MSFGPEFHYNRPKTEGEHRLVRQQLLGILRPMWEMAPPQVWDDARLLMPAEAVIHWLESLNAADTAKAEHIKLAARQIALTGVLEDLLLLVQQPKLHSQEDMDRIVAAAQAAMKENQK